MKKHGLSAYTSTINSILFRIGARHIGQSSVPTNMTIYGYIEAQTVIRIDDDTITTDSF